MLLDPKSDIPLSHWSLPAITRLNPGQMPALYSPGDDATETLELEESDMILALETVRNAVTSKLPKPGRLRGMVLTSGTLLVLVFALFWLPGALREHTASVLPASTRAAIGQAALSDVQRLTGTACTTPLGNYTLTALGDKLIGPHKVQIMIMRDGIEASAHLPGGVILINRRFVEDQPGPEVLAGLILAERLRAETKDPILSVLNYTGLPSTFRLLTSGALPTANVKGYGETLLQAPPLPISDEELLARFAQAGISSTPYAQWLDPTGESETAQTLRQGDPLRGLSPEALMADGDWVALQDICSASS